MKIAICLYGEPRTWQLNLPHLRTFFRSHTHHFFYHAWNSNYGPPIAQAELDAMHKEIGPFNSLVETLPESFPNYTTKTLTRDEAPNYYSAMRALHLRRQHEIEQNFNYDLVALIRFDTKFEPTCRVHEKDNFDPYTIYTPRLRHGGELGHWKAIYEIGTEALLGRPAIMDMVGNLYHEAPFIEEKWVWRHHKRAIPVGPQHLYYWFIRSLNLSVAPYYMPIVNT